MAGIKYMSLTKKIVIGVFVFMLLSLVAFVTFTMVNINNFIKTDKILSNVYFSDINIGGVTKEEALSILEKSETILDKPIEVVYEDKTFYFAPSKAGITFDFKKVADYAFNMGRGSNNIKNAYYTLYRGRKDIAPYEFYNENTDLFKETINTLAKANGLDIDNVILDVKENYAQITLKDKFVTIDFNTFYADTLNAVKSDERKVNLNIIDKDSVSAKEIYALLNVEPQDAYTYEKDGITYVVPERVGVLVDISNIEENLNLRKKTFSVPITRVYPEVDISDLDGELFPDLLGTCTTTFNAQNKERSHNVFLAASKINGVVLNSKDIFSYNNTVGPRTGAAGFKSATVYTKEGMEDALGGGICQVSSALYNAVLYSDLKVVERRNHSYTVSYVRNGLDATVSYGLIDFQFENSMNSPIKIVTYTSGGKHTVSIYGKKENDYKVELYTNVLESYPFSEKEVENPELAPGERKITQNGAYGYKVLATKVVKDSLGNIIREESLGTNVYNPMTQIVAVGPTPEIQPTIEIVPPPLEEEVITPVDKVESEEITIPDTEENNIQIEEITIPTDTKSTDNVEEIKE